MSNLMDLSHAHEAALSAARAGAEVIRATSGSAFKVTKKGAIDLLTEADTGSEAAIIDTLTTHFPEHGILSEERGVLAGSGPYQWIVDPLDGTTNFAHGLPFYAVSLALAREDELLLGVVLNPDSGELFSAVKGGGAQLNGAPLSVSPTAKMVDSLLVTGFPYNFQGRYHELIERFGRVLQQAQGVRRLGSAALDLCYVACGRFEGFWEQNLNPWDTAAGVLMVREAGGRVTDFSNTAFDPLDHKEVLATNGHIHEALRGFLSIEDLP